MAVNDEVISTLNNLIETCKDGQNGFTTAAEGVNRSDLKNLFMNYAQQRGEFARELQQEVRNLGGDPENGGSIAATLHRGWINVKSAVTGDDESAVIAECERGEDSAVSNYKDALEQSLPPKAQALVLRQYNEVKAAHDRIRSLERASIRSA
jgi:uncharacterized protein (TIGR02284 family)